MKVIGLETCVLLTQQLNNFDSLVAPDGLNLYSNLDVLDSCEMHVLRYLTMVLRCSTVLRYVTSFF